MPLHHDMLRRFLPFYCEQDHSPIETFPINEFISLFPLERTRLIVSFLRKLLKNVMLLDFLEI